MMKNRHICLIRHGKTDANLKKLYCGSTDLPLSEVGRREIEENKQKKCYPTGDFFYTSTLQRTYETLILIYGNVKFVKVTELKEIDFGQFEMKSYEDLKYNSHYIKWIEDISGDVVCPNGESANLLKKRVHMGLQKIIVQTPADFSKLVLVTHGGVIASIMEFYFGNEKNFYEWQPKCGLGYSLVLENKNIVGYELI